MNGKDLQVEGYFIYWVRDNLYNDIERRIVEIIDGRTKI